MQAIHRITLTCHVLHSFNPCPARCRDEPSLCPAGGETPRAQPGADGLASPSLFPFPDEDLNLSLGSFSLSPEPLNRTCVLQVCRVLGDLAQC